MVIDTSALVALLLNEPDALRIVRAIEAASVRLVSAATFLETSIVIESKKGEAGGRELELLLYRASIEVAPVDQDQAEIARQAWRAGLNYGDCFAYALAKQRHLPLLFRGDDFAQTDVPSVPL